MTKPTETDTRTAIWDSLAKTDPAHTKPFNRSGGFKGTAIKPIWIVRRLTETFGPCGIGWGSFEPHYQVVPCEGEILVFCTVSAWHGSKDNVVFGVGGDKVQAKRQSGFFCDDEAFKKAFTDALGNAFKFIGVAADVHMGLFDDSKYVQEMRQEFAPAEQEQRQKPKPLEGLIKTRGEIRTKCGEFVRDLHGCGDADQLDIVLADNAPLINQVKAELEFFWLGDGADFKGLAREIEEAKASFDDSWKSDVTRSG